MSFQVLVKTTAVMNGAYTFLLADRKAAMEFVQRPDVWWYHFPEEDDDWRWHRGGAWKPAHELGPGDIETDRLARDFAAAAMPEAVTVQWQDEEDGDDDRW